MKTSPSEDRFVSRIRARLARVPRPAWLAALAVATLTLVAADPPGQRNPFEGKRLYVDPSSPAERQAREWERTRPEDAQRIRRIAEQPKAHWTGGWVRDIRSEVARVVSAVTGAGALPVFVAYNIPHRDCGHHSAGGEQDAEAYRRWVREFAAGLGKRPSIVILEPDALAGMDCLAAADQEERVQIIREAVQALKAGGASVYIDAGNPKWIPAEEMARRLERAGIEAADGFALNISNFHSTAANVAYGEQLSRLTGGKHFVIDTSRNGVGNISADQWCNPRGQALGVEPTTRTGHPLIDAYLWIKTPGESDGECEGGPRAGAWWAEYALELSKMAEVLAGTMPRVAVSGR